MMIFTGYCIFTGFFNRERERERSRASEKKIKKRLLRIRNAVNLEKSI